MAKPFTRAHLYKVMSHLLDSRRQTLQPQVDKTLQSQRQHAGSNQCWLVFGEILGLRTLFDSVFPVKAIPSHADMGLERGNSHSCLLEGAISSAGRQGPPWNREELKRSQGANPGPCFQARSRHPRSWAGTSPNIFLAWKRGPRKYLLSTAWP